MDHPRPYFTDAELDEMCEGLTQDAARIRYLRGLGLRVDRKPNGKPLAWRPTDKPAPAPEAQNDDAAPNIVALQAWSNRKRGQRGQKAQGR